MNQIMSTFKENIYSICAEVSSLFPGWDFASGQFRNKTLKHTDLIVHLGFGFEANTTPVQPSIAINNKRAGKLCRRLLGTDSYTSVVSLQVVGHTLVYTPENLRFGYWILQNKDDFSSVGQSNQAVRDTALDISEARSALISTMKDSIAFIESHYDLSSEESLLKGLPAKYATRHVNSPYDQEEKFKGVMLCLVRILLGDFDFVARYQSDDFITMFPKRVPELNKIMMALPELKDRFAEAGTVI